MFVIEVIVRCKVKQEKENGESLLNKKLSFFYSKKKKIIELIEQKKTSIIQHTHFIRFRGRWIEWRIYKNQQNTSLSLRSGHG